MIYNINIIKRNYIDFSGNYYTIRGITRNVKGVYVLYNNININDGFSCDVQYVGQGKIYDRIQTHTKTKDFTHAIAIRCKDKRLRIVLEKILIELLKPKQNKMFFKWCNLLNESMKHNEKAH